MCGGIRNLAAATRVDREGEGGIRDPIRWLEWLNYASVMRPTGAECGLNSFLVWRSSVAGCGGVRRDGWRARTGRARENDTQLQVRLGEWMIGARLMDVTCLEYGLCRMVARVDWWSASGGVRRGGGGLT